VEDIQAVEDIPAAALTSHHTSAAALAARRILLVRASTIWPLTPAGRHFAADLIRA
jgi:hypothetical protein